MSPSQRANVPDPVVVEPKDSSSSPASNEGPSPTTSHHSKSSDGSSRSNDLSDAIHKDVRFPYDFPYSDEKANHAFADRKKLVLDFARKTRRTLKNDSPKDGGLKDNDPEGGKLTDDNLKGNTVKDGNEDEEKHKEPKMESVFEKNLRVATTLPLNFALEDASDALDHFECETSTGIGNILIGGLPKSMFNKSTDKNEDIQLGLDDHEIQQLQRVLVSVPAPRARDQSY
jgi:hypothetical protein